MSKKTLSFPKVLVVFGLIIQIVNNSVSQQPEPTRMPDGIAEVKGKFLKRPFNQRNLSFLGNYAGVSGLSERLYDLALLDSQGNSIHFKRFIPGEYVADADITSWRYKVNLKPPANPSAAAHVSWMNHDIAIIMLRDLLPQNLGGSVRGDVWVSTPMEGKTFPSLPFSDDQLNTDNLDSVVVVMGEDLRAKGDKVDGEDLNTVVNGQWQFTDDDAHHLALEVFRKYGEMFSLQPHGPFQITIAKFPVKVPLDQWEADTRGTSVLILSSDTPFKSQSIQRLHEQLRHEIFHLWIPEGVKLTGNYDWFYEGFALYESLKVGLAVNRIGFDNYLDTLSRAYDIDRHDSHKLNLIEASKQRWNGANTQVYARGMLVAFLCDLALLEHSKGKTSVTDLVAELYRKYRPPAAKEDGNTAVIALMRSHPELVPIVEQYISGSETIAWEPLLKAAGLEADAGGRLTVSARLSGNQKDLLDKLGYNNWRKLPRSKK